MTTPDREDTASEALLAQEARRDVQDTLNAEFASGVAAHAARRHDEEEATAAGQRGLSRERCFRPDTPD